MRGMCRASRGELCQLLRGERSPLCLQLAAANLFPEPRSSKRRYESVCAQASSLWRAVLEAVFLQPRHLHVFGSQGCYSAAGRRPYLPNSSVAVVTGLIYSAIKRGSVEVYTGILCFQCGIHNHNPRFTPEADPLLHGCAPSVLCRTAGVVRPAWSRGN